MGPGVAGDPVARPRRARRLFFRPSLVRDRGGRLSFPIRVARYVSNDPPLRAVRSARRDARRRAGERPARRVSPGSDGGQRRAFARPEPRPQPVQAPDLRNPKRDRRSRRQRRVPRPRTGDRRRSGSRSRTVGPVPAGPRRRGRRASPLSDGARRESESDGARVSRGGGSRAPRGSLRTALDSRDGRGRGGARRCGGLLGAAAPPDRRDRGDGPRGRLGPVDDVPDRSMGRRPGHGP